MWVVAEPPNEVHSKQMYFATLVLRFIILCKVW